MNSKDIQQVFRLSKMIWHSAWTMKCIINNLLDRLDIQKKSLKPNYVPSDLRQIIFETIEVMRFVASNKDIKIDFVCRLKDYKKYLVDLNRI